jgi:hypothetical protein
MQVVWAEYLVPKMLDGWLGSIHLKRDSRWKVILTGFGLIARWRYTPREVCITVSFARIGTPNMPEQLEITKQ